MVFLLPVAIYSIFGLGVSIGVWTADEDAYEETPLIRAAVVLVGMVVWPVLVWRRLRDAKVASSEH